MPEIDIFSELIGSWKSFKAPRRTHRRIDVLSQEARNILLEGFREKATYRAIRDRIAARTGEDLPERSIGRAGVVWRAAQRRAPVQEEVSAVLGRLCWRTDELVELASAVETSIGADLRRRKRIYQALRGFLKDPNCIALRCLERELVLFALEYRISGQGGSE